MMEDNVITMILERLPAVSQRPSDDHPAFNVAVDELVLSLQILRDEFGYNLLTDLTAIDWGVDASPRFTGIYHVYSLTTHSTVRIATDCQDAIEPTLPSIVDLWPAANWHERETFDMFGIRYDGHPDLRRILMWDAFPHYPLRKDFPLAGFETDLPAEDITRVTQAKVKPAPMMGGPFHAPQADAMSNREPRAADQSWTEHSPKPN